MDWREQALRFWGRTALLVGVPAGLASTALTWVLRGSLIAEQSLSAAGFESQCAGPSVLLLLLWGACGHLSGSLAERHLGLDGLLAVAVSAAGSVVALVVYFVSFAALARGLPEITIIIGVAGAVIWTGVAAQRTYVG